jgi:hypothetical protein
MARGGKQSVGKVRRLGVLLFGLVFFAIGVSAAYFLVLPDLRDWRAAQAYVPAPAKLLSVELQRHHGSKSTTYKVRAAYRYDYRGQQFTGTRVAISDSADNIGDYHQRLYSRLRAVKQRGGDVTAWVNPANPREALLARDMRWGLFAFKSLFFALFGLFGGGVAIYALRAPAVAAAVSPQPIPRQPSGRIVANTRKAMWGWWIFAGVWNLVSTPMLFLLPRELAKGNWPALAILLFTVVGLWLLYTAVHTTLQWRRFGALVLTLAPYPGAIGGGVTGTIELPGRFRMAEVFRVTVTCVRRRTSGSGRNRRTTDTALWQDETRAQTNASGRGTQLKFAFNVPAGLPPSGAPSRDYVFWAVDINADLPGVDLDSRFEVPMVPAEPGANQVPLDISPTSPTSAVPDIPPRIVRIFHDSGATVFYYPLLRNPAMSIGLVVFGSIFSGAVWLMANELHRGAFGIVLWPMIAIFGLVSALLLVGGLYTLGNTLRVEISPRGLTTIRRIYGFGFARHARLQHVKSVEIKIGSQSNSGRRIRVRYRLIAHIGDGRKITLGNDIPSRALAEYLAQKVREACGVREDPN